MHSRHHSGGWREALAVSILLVGCGGDGDDSRSDGPTSQGTPVVHATGNATAGRDVFRFSRRSGACISVTPPQDEGKNQCSDTALPAPWPCPP